MDIKALEDPLKWQKQKKIKQRNRALILINFFTVCPVIMMLLAIFNDVSQCDINEINILLYSLLGVHIVYMMLGNYLVLKLNPADVPTGEGLLVFLINVILMIIMSVAYFSSSCNGYRSQVILVYLVGWYSLIPLSGLIYLICECNAKAHQKKETSEA